MSILNTPYSRLICDPRVTHMPLIAGLVDVGVANGGMRDLDAHVVLAYEEMRTHSADITDA